MSDLRKAAQMALDWRDKNSELLFELGGWDFIFEINDWSQSIRGALAQPEQEPVAWMVVNGEGKIEQTSHYKPECERWLKYDPTRRLVPLYTAPPQREWQGLTDEDKREIIDETEPEDRGYVMALVEAKLKEKNHAN